MSMKLKWVVWFYGLGKASIGGGAGAVVSGLTSIGLAPDKFNLVDWAGASKVITMMAINFLVTAIISLVFYLKQSPLPELVEEDTTMIRKDKE